LPRHFIMTTEAEICTNLLYQSRKIEDRNYKLCFFAIYITMAWKIARNESQKAHQATFQWIFETDRMNDKKWSNFKDWLESDSRLYWMTGKAGFGKSTLMKFISQRFPDSPGEEPRCWKHLKHWAGDDHLVIATFFFWNSGFPIQMTQSGLFRSLLNQILNLPSDTKLCLFVDSLDEFDGDHKALIRLFRDVTI